MFSWVFNLIKPEPVELSPDIDDDEEDLSNVFLTHQILSKQQRSNVFKEAFQVVPDDFPLIQSTGMDGVTDNTDPAKNLFRIGRQRIPEKLFAWFVSQGFIGYQACSFIAQNWLVNKACTMKGKDAVRKGFDIVFDEGKDVDPSVNEQMEKIDKRLKLKANLVRADKFKNVFGISHILFLVNSKDPEYYEKPFNPDGVEPGSYRGMTHIDPYWITPLLTTESVANPESVGFYEPEYWVISGNKYHKSHFVILRGAEVSDILKPSYLYGGLPLSQLIMERVYAAERTANEAPQLALSKRLVIRYIENLAKVIAKPNEFYQALEMLAEWRDNYGVFVESNKNRIEQQDTSLSDLDTVIMTQYQIVAGIAEVPATKLMGTSPKGFQSTGEHEIKTYHETLETLQENDLEPIVNRHHICVMRSYVAPFLEGRAPLNVGIVWRPLAVMTDKEIAETNELKSRTAANYQNTGAVDAYDIRDSLIADEDSDFSGIEAIDRPDEIEDLEPLEEETEPQPGGYTESEQTPTTDAETADYVGKEKNRWYIYSKTGEKLEGGFKRQYQAKERLKEIEAARHAKKGV